MSKSLEALKKIWHYAIQEHNNLFINDVFDNCYMPIKQDLELLGSLKQIWNNQEFCKGIPLSADGLNSLFNYNLDMFNKNLELDKKVLDLVINRKKSPYPKSNSKKYHNMVVSLVENILKDKSSILYEIFDIDKIKELMYSSSELDIPWYGQLMRKTSYLAYLYQIDFWFKKYNIKVEGIDGKCWFD